MGAQNPFSRQPGGPMPPPGIAPPMSGSPFGQQTGLQFPPPNLAGGAPGAPPMGMPPQGMNPAIAAQLQRMFGPGAQTGAAPPAPGQPQQQFNPGMMARGLLQR